MKQKKTISKFRYFFLKYIIAMKIKRALKLTARDKYKRLIINLGGRYIILKRSELKKLTKLNKAGLPIREIEKRAIFKTY